MKRRSLLIGMMALTSGCMPQLAAGGGAAADEAPLLCFVRACGLPLILLGSILYLMATRQRRTGSNSRKDASRATSADAHKKERNSK